MPAATEIVCALGAKAGLVGVSHECDFPAAVRALPVLTASRVGNDSSSAAIDRPGPRLVESLEILAACIQPELFQDFALKHQRVLLPLVARGHQP